MLTRRERFMLTAITLIVAGFLVVPTLDAQLQQSGGPGSTVTANAGTNLNTSALALDSSVSTVDTDLKANITLHAGSNVIGHVIVDTAPTTAVTIATAPALVASSAIIGKTVPATACGTTVSSVALAALPTSSTLATSAATTCVIAVFFENSNAGTQTVTLTDNTGTPLNAVGPAFVVPGLSNMVIPLYGIAFTNGVKWLAGGTGVLGGLIGYQ